LLFPFGDLGGLITTQVAKQTNNQIYLKFDKMNLSLFPTPGFDLTNVLVRSTQFPEVKCEDLKIAPSIAGLLSFKPGVSVAASGFMGGDVSLTTRGTSKTKAGILKQNISLSVDSVDLSKIASEMGLPMNLEGKVNLDGQAELDPSFVEQPQGQIDLKAIRLNITSANVPTPIGPLNLPDTKLQELEFKGELSKGELNFDKVQIGTPEDELYARVRGTMQVKVESYGGNGLTLVPSAYDLTVQIKTKPSYQTKAGLFLGFLDNYKKSSTAQGTEYIFKASGSNFYAPPKMTPINAY
jgi:type II secretion system protein N